MASLKKSKKGIASLLIFILILHTVSGFSTAGASSGVLTPVKSAKHKRSAVKTAKKEEYMGLDKKRSDLEADQIISIVGEDHALGNAAEATSKRGAWKRRVVERSSEDFLRRIKNVVAEQLGVNVEEVKLESNFVDDLGADSLDVVELIMAIEEEFGIEIPDEKAEELTTVQLLLNYVESYSKN